MIRTTTALYILRRTSAALTHVHDGQLPGGPMSIDGHANLGMLCVACYLMFKHRVYWKYQYNKYLFNFIDHLHFYSCD